MFKKRKSAPVERFVGHMEPFNNQAGFIIAINEEGEWCVRIVIPYLMLDHVSKIVGVGKKKRRVLDKNLENVICGRALTDSCKIEPSFLRDEEGNIVYNFISVCFVIGRSQTRLNPNFEAVKEFAPDIYEENSVLYDFMIGVTRQVRRDWRMITLDDAIGIASSVAKLFRCSYKSTEKFSYYITKPGDHYEVELKFPDGYQKLLNENGIPQKVVKSKLLSFLWSLKHEMNNMDDNKISYSIHSIAGSNCVITNANRKTAQFDIGSDVLSNVDHEVGRIHEIMGDIIQRMIQIKEDDINET